MIVNGITPILNVSDIRASFAWFKKLGWGNEWEWEDPPTFGGISSGKVQIFHCLNGQGGHGEDGVWISLWVEDVDSVYQECIANGIEVTRPPTDMPWNVREMHVRHPDGHMLRIGKGFEEEKEEEEKR